MGRNAKKFSKNFDWDVITKKYEIVYKSLI